MKQGVTHLSVLRHKGLQYTRLTACSNAVRRKLEILTLYLMLSDIFVEWRGRWTVRKM
jgi:hypothetical protein